MFSVHLPITENLLDKIKPLHQFIKINDYNKEAVFDNLTYFSFNSRMLSAVNYFFKKNIIELKLYLELSKETENDLRYNIINNNLHSDFYTNFSNHDINYNEMKKILKSIEEHNIFKKNINEKHINMKKL